MAASEVIETLIEDIHPSILKTLLTKLEYPEIAKILNDEYEATLDDIDHKLATHKKIIEAVLALPEDEERGDILLETFSSINLARSTSVNGGPIKWYVCEYMKDALKAKPVDAPLKSLQACDYAALAWIYDNCGSGPHWQHIQWHLVNNAIGSKKTFELTRPRAFPNPKIAACKLKFENELQAILNYHQPSNESIVIKSSEMDKSRMLFTIYYSRDGEVRWIFDKLRRLRPKIDNGAGIISIEYDSSLNVLNIKESEKYTARKEKLARAFAKCILGADVIDAIGVTVHFDEMLKLGRHPNIIGAPGVQHATLSCLNYNVKGGSITFKSYPTHLLEDTEPSLDVYAEARRIIGDNFDDKNIDEAWIEVAFVPGFIPHTGKNPRWTVKLTPSRYEIYPSSKIHEVHDTVKTLLYEKWRIVE